MRVVADQAAEQGLAADQKAAGIHSGPDSETVAVASAELFATVAEIVATADEVIDVRAVDGRIDATVGETVDAERAVADEATDAAVVGAEGATSGEVTDEQDIRRETEVPGTRSFRPATLAADRYLADTSASRQTACSSVDCSERRYCRRSPRRY